MDRIAKRVIHYMFEKDSSGRTNPHFAIAMYGEWGSGKTHYCETVLRKELKGTGCELTRISLFGVTSPDGIYNRLLAALCQMEGNAKSRVKKLAAETLVGSIRNFLRVNGIDLALDTETLVSAISMEKRLIVLDDGERMNADEDGKTPSWVIGTVNNMVENLHWHVMLIRNLNSQPECGRSRFLELR